MQPAPSADDDEDLDSVGDGRVRRARGRDFVEYKGRDYEDLVQDGLASAVPSAPPANETMTEQIRRQNAAGGAPPRGQRAQDVTDVYAEDVRAGSGDEEMRSEEKG
jgi:hypothetical protein